MYQDPYSKATKTRLREELRKEIKEGHKKLEEMYHVHGSRDSILLRCSSSVLSVSPMKVPVDIFGGRNWQGWLLYSYGNTLTNLKCLIKFWKRTMLEDVVKVQ